MLILGRIDYENENVVIHYDLDFTSVFSEHSYSSYYNPSQPFFRYSLQLLPTK